MLGALTPPSTAVTTHLLRVYYSCHHQQQPGNSLNEVCALLSNLLPGKQSWQLHTGWACSENRNGAGTAEEAEKQMEATERRCRQGTAPTLGFFSGLGGSSLLGGAVMSFPLTASAALGSSALAGGGRNICQFKFLFFFCLKMNFLVVIQHSSSRRQN